VQCDVAVSTISKAQVVFAVKWLSSLVQILGYAATSFGFTPWNLYLFLIGVLGWFAVGAFWNDRALMLVHVVAFAAKVAGMMSG